jgi:hypothetical protein
VFADDFTTPSSSTWSFGSDVAIGSSNWSAYTASYHGVRINGGVLEVTNQRGSSTDHGQGYAYVPTTGASSQYDNGLYNATLADNAGAEIVWTFNMRRNNPESTAGGFSCTSSGSQNGRTVGLAYVLATDSAANLNANPDTCNASATAVGYAVVMGRYSGTSGTVRLVRFESGLRNGVITDLVESSGNSVASHFSVRVTYTSDTDTWQLEVRNDGSSFTDPQGGSYTLVGSTQDAVHTSTSLGYSGPYFQSGCTGFCDVDYIAKFDNVDVTVACP